MAVNPFDALGLPARPDLTDEQVRAAWRAIAAATHPDRRDGGDVARYTAATAAYAVLRTAWGRSEAFADLALAVDDTSPLPAVDGSAVEGGPAASTGGGRPGDLLDAVVQLPARRPEGTHHRLLQRGDDHDRAQPEDETLVIDALRMAVENRRPRTGYPGAAALRRGLRCRGPAKRQTCVTSSKAASHQNPDANRNQRALRTEMRRRTKVIRELGETTDRCPENKVTPELARARGRLR